MKTPSKIKRAVIKSLCIIMFSAGLALISYPFIANYLFEQQQASSSYQYQDITQNPNETQRLASMRASAQDYNDALDNIARLRFTLLVSRLSGLADDQARRNSALEETAAKELMETQPELSALLFSYPDLLNVTPEKTIATIEIPAIKVNLPIYHGTSVETLSKGVGHLEGTSLPIGGSGSHCALTAHTGMVGKDLFTRINELKLGDEFTLHAVSGNLYYQIDQILTIEPSDISALALDPNKDYVTLITCTPYGFNTHRLLVRGIRIDSSEATHPVATESGNTLTNKVVEENPAFSPTLLPPAANTGYFLPLALVLLAFLLTAAKLVRRQRRCKPPSDSAPPKESQR